MSGLWRYGLRTILGAAGYSTQTLNAGGGA